MKALKTCLWEGCGQTFTNTKDLVIHVEDVHVVPFLGSEYFCCLWDQCMRLDVNNGEEMILQHLRVHTGEKPYMCPICSDRFHARSSCISHGKRMHRKGIDPIYIRARDRSDSDEPIQEKPVEEKKKKRIYHPQSLTSFYREQADKISIYSSYMLSMQKDIEQCRDWLHGLALDKTLIDSRDNSLSILASDIDDFVVRLGDNHKEILHLLDHENE